MHNEKPSLHGTFQNSGTGEVRHLVTELVNGYAEVKLVQLQGGIETLLSTGTSREVSTRADDFVREWGAEGFKREQQPVFESLAAVVALARKLDFHSIQDPKFKNLDFGSGRINVAGIVSLTSWPGMSSPRGIYEYAFDHLRVQARPMLTRSEIVRLNSMPNIMLRLKEAINAQKAIGPEGTFLLVGED